MQAWLGGKVVFLIQMLLTFGRRGYRYFWDVRLTIVRFNMLFQPVLTKFFKSEPFSCLIYRKLITCPHAWAKAYWIVKTEKEKTFIYVYCFTTDQLQTALIFFRRYL